MRLKITVTWEPDDKLWGFSELLDEMPDATIDEKIEAIMGLITECDPCEIWSEGVIDVDFD